MSSPSAPPAAAERRAAVILAAGKGTRMRSARPKVLHQAGGQPLLAWPIAAARAAGCSEIVIVVGHGADAIRAEFAGNTDLIWVEQTEQLGTGHALLQADGAITAAGLLLVLSGDVPLVRAATLDALARAAARNWGAMAVANVAEPGALGRVIDDLDGALGSIVEARDATPAQLAIQTVNAGLYALPAPAIFDFLRQLEPHNAQGELYLTDALGTAARTAGRIELVALADPDEALGVNDRIELARAHRKLINRRLAELAHAGVTILDPATVTVDAAVSIGRDTTVSPGVHLLGRTRIGDGVTLAAGVWVRDSEIADGAVIEPYSVLDGARVGPGCRVGPFARLRPGAVLEAAARVGNFVEVKNSRLGAGAKANHLAYLGDATVGAQANIGAGVITCNYDGEAKHATEIGERAFIGSDTMLVAPVRVGADATTGAGSVITKDVPDGALAVERAPQRVVAGWSGRRPPRAKKE